jgi:hypothetical protein
MIRQYENETFVKRSQRALKGQNQGQKLSIIQSQVNANLVGCIEVEMVQGKRRPSQREHCCASKLTTSKDIKRSWKPKVRNNCFYNLNPQMGMKTHQQPSVKSHSFNRGRLPPELKSLPHWFNSSLASSLILEFAHPNHTWNAFFILLL